MLKIGAIKQVYKNCIHWTTLWLKRNAYAVSETGAVFCRKKDSAGNDIVEATVTLHFRDWPQRDKSPERIDILASMVETISRDNGTCEKARLWV